MRVPDVDDARGRGGTQGLKQEVGQQEGRQVIDGQGHLDAIRAQAPGREGGARIVYQQV